MDVPHEVDHRNWSHRTKFPRRSHCATDWANTQLYARFSASLILFTCRLPVGIAWIPRCVFICSAGETCSFLGVFFPGWSARRKVTCRFSVGPLFSSASGSCGRWVYYHHEKKKKSLPFYTQPQRCVGAASGDKHLHSLCRGSVS